MTTISDAMHNGRKESRRSLSHEFDRFDKMLDGLAEAIPAAVADAVKEAVSTAVTEAVRATLFEIVSNPEIISMLHGITTPVVSRPSREEVKSTSADHPKLHARVRRGLTSAWRWSLAKVRGIRQKIASCARNIRDGAARTFRRVNTIWALKRPLVIALLVGFVAGIVSYASSPCLAGLVSGVSATGAALGMQLALFVRRLFAGFPAHRVAAH